MIGGTLWVHNPRGRRTTPSPTILLETWHCTMFISRSHGVRVIRPECSNTESAHFQLNNKIALKRDGWVFVLCQVKVLGQPQHWTKSRDLNINTWAAQSNLQDPAKNDYIFVIYRDVTMISVTVTSWQAASHSVVSLLPWHGPMSLLMQWPLTHCLMCVCWGYSLHIPQTLSTTDIAWVFIEDILQRFHRHYPLPGPHTGPGYQWHLSTKAHNSDCHSGEVHIKHICKE